MEIKNTFRVAAPAAEAWTILTDIERIAPCVPGAELTEVVDQSTYKGKVSVRLGPVALSFNGTARFEEIDNTGYRARVLARGMDPKGRGGAEASVTFTLVPDEEGSKVHILTDLQLSGSIAQYGRGAGMIADLATQLIAEFASCLNAQLAARGTEAAAGASAPPAKPISGLRLGLRLLWNAVKRLFGGG